MSTRRPFWPPRPLPSFSAVSQERGGWHETCAGVLALTKMDWNNNTLYKKLPVTLVYSKAFANIVQQNPNIVDSRLRLPLLHVSGAGPAGVGQRALSGGKPP